MNPSTVAYFSVRGRWFGAVAEPAKEPKSAFAQSLAAEQCDRDHRERHHNLGDGEDLAEQRMEHADARGSAQRGSADNSGPPGHPFAARRGWGWLTCGKILHTLIYCPDGTLG
jgi:hypothetical protein